MLAHQQSSLHDQHAAINEPRALLLMLHQLIAEPVIMLTNRCLQFSNISTQAIYISNQSNPQTKPTNFGCKPTYRLLLLLLHQTL